MSQYTSYYLYQKYEKRGDQPWLPSYPNVYSVDGDGTMPLVVKQEDDPSCGYIPPPTPIYRWIDLDPSTDWICSSCDVKASGTYESGQTFTIDCNGSTTLESGDTTGFTGLEYIRIGDCVTEIGTEALQARPNLVGATIPPSVTSIGNRAFFNDAGLEDCAIPQSVTSIGSEAFRNCISLRNVMLWDSITSIGASAFTNCDFIIDINIPTGLTSISSSCFRDCGALSEVTIPPTITSIGDNAFNGCTGLMSITCLAQVPPTLGSSAFSNTNDCEINIPCDSFAAYQTAWSEYSDRLQPLPPCEITGKFVALYTNGNQYVVPCNDNPTLTSNETKGYSVVSYEYMLSAEIGDCCTAIGNLAFERCSGLTSVNIPSGVTSIGQAAFSNCSVLTNVSIPSGVTSIGRNAFYFCTSLTSVTIPSGITTINAMTFLGCRSLTNVTIPSGVTYIDEYAFKNCSGLTSITVDAETPPTIPYDGKPFDNTNDCPIYVPCYSVSQYKNTSGWSTYSSRIQRNPNCQPPAGTKWVAVYTGGTAETAPCDFSGTIASGEIELTDLSEIEVGSCVTAIGESAFSGCTTLSAVTVPNTLTTMMGNAFNGCSSLTSIFIPSGIDIVNFIATQGGFKNCSSLTSVTVDSNSIISGNMSYSTGICTYCFGSQVKECTIGENVTAIGNRAFYRCANLTSVTIPNTVTKIGSQSFYNSTGLTSVTIPDSVTSIGQSAFNSCYGLTDITLGSGLTTIGESAFGSCRSLTSITIPDSVTTISGSAFQNCSGLTSVTIGTGITKIEDNAFWKCSGLTGVTVLATTPPTLSGTSVFDDTNNCPIYVPAQSLTDYQNATRWAEYSSRIQPIT